MFGLSKYVMVGGGVIIAMMGLAIWYLRIENTTLTTNNATLRADRVVLETQIKEINNSVILLETQRVRDQESIIKISKDLSNFREESNRLSEIFRKHNLSTLSAAKPKLIENIINKGTAKVGKDLEELTND